MRLRLVANVRRKQSKLDGLLANVCERSQTFSFIERRADVQCSVKSRMNGSAKNINTGQPAWTAQTDSI